MPLREAVKFLKGAVSSTSRGAQTYSFHDGRCWVRSERAYASYPTAHIQGTFAMAAEDLDAALSRMPSEPAIEAGDEGTMVLRSGRLRSQVDLLPADGPSDEDAEGWDGLAAAPPKLLAALASVTPFLDAEGTWQRSVLLSAGSLTVMSNKRAARLTFPALIDLPAPLPLPAESADYLTGLGAEPAKWLPETNAVRFEWHSGARVRCQLLAEGWPDLATRVIGMAEDATTGRELPVEITDAWREAFADAAALAKVDNEIRVLPDALVVRSAHGSHRIEFETGVTKETTWTIPFLKPMIDAATFWDPDRDGPGVFVGPDLRGLVARSSGR